MGCFPVGGLSCSVSSASCPNDTPATARSNRGTRGSTMASSPEAPTRVEIKVRSTLAIASRLFSSSHKHLRSGRLAPGQ